MSQGEGRASGEFVKLTPAQEAARKRRGLLLTLCLFGFVVLVFIITISRLGENAKAVSDSRDFNSAVEYFTEDGQQIDAGGQIVADEADKHTSDDDEVNQ